MKLKEAVIKSELYPFVLHVTGSEDDIDCFESLIADSSDMAGYIIHFTDKREIVPLDPCNYRVEGKNIFEWRKESIALADRVSELEHHVDYAVDDNRALTLQLVKALNAKPPYKDLLDLVADLEGYLMSIKKIVEEAIERDRL